MSETEPATTPDAIRSPDRSTSTTTLLAVLLLIATFVAGIILGFAADHYLMMHPRAGQHTAAFIVRRLDRRLDLSDQQEATITKIVERHQNRIAGVWKNVGPQIRTEIDQTNVEIETVLTPEQRLKFQEVKMRLAPRRGGGGMRFRHD